MAARAWTLGAVLIGAWLVAESATFSSRLVHRFSDELRERRRMRRGGAWAEESESHGGAWAEESSSHGGAWEEKSRSHGGAWAEEGRRTMEYYGALLGGDLERQRMRLGSRRHQLVFPSEGSKFVSFGNAWAWLHYTWIDIGTPNISFLVALDAGSDLLWVPCDCIQCAPLSASYYTVLDRDMNEYSPSISSTSKHLSCSHQLCDLGSVCDSPKQPCPYTINYYSENTSSSGLLVVDTLHLASTSDDASSTSVQAPVVLGCAMKQSGSYLEGAAPDGLLGLGPGEISVPSFLSKAGLVRNSFSMCFKEDDSGRIYFGDQGPATQQSTPFLLTDGKFMSYMVGVDGCCIGNSCLKKTSFTAQIDSGTSFTFLPTDIFEAVAKEFDRRVNMTRFNYEQSPFKYCYKTRSTELPKIPSLKFMFAPNNSFVVQTPVIGVSNDEASLTQEIEFCLGIQEVDGDFGLIGQNYMTGYRLVFDRENMQFGWSRSNCQDLADSKRLPINTNGNSTNPLPTNEQQRSYDGGRAVTPAVAGRAPSNNKPSAASTRHISYSGFVFRAVLMLTLIFHRHVSFP